MNSFNMRPAPSPDSPSPPENFDPNKLSREQMLAAIEAAETTLFRTKEGVMDVRGKETRVGQGSDGTFIIYWGETARIRDFGLFFNPANPLKKYPSFEDAMQALLEACAEKGCTVRKE